MDDEEDEYVSYGTPLPELEDEATLKKKAAKELQVRDEQGRQRFHGAFTGGFSAGYFNTVGTKEGWAPSTFASSRNKIAERVQQNPEDFMDDEDLGVFGIAHRKIHTTSNFQDGSDVISRKRKYINTDTVIPGEAPLKDIVQPVSESIGIQILKKLGWREGQGIGPRVKKHASSTKVYGCSPFPDAVVPEEDDPIAATFTFAPKDTEAMFYQPKDNYFGLGYIGLSKQSVLSTRTDIFSPTSTKSWLPKDKKKLTISGQAFGVGAFEDEDADIYGKDDMSQYDFSDLALKGAEDVHKVIEPKKAGHSQDIVEGFLLASQPPSVKKHYPAPALPPNFRPVHLKSVYSETQSVNLDKSRHALSSSDRSLILGEKRFEKLPSNVSNVQIEKNKVAEEQPKPTSSASTVGLTFRPFPNDIPKQQRYEEYLRLKKEGDIIKLVQPSSMTEWEKQQEIEEFSKAAVLFKPLSNVLSSRFESKSHLGVEHEVMAALAKIKKEKEVKPAAVKKNLIGISNRNTFEWHPVSLLCKRMNVPNPYPNSESSGSQRICQTKSVFGHLSFTNEKSHSQEDSAPVQPPNTDLESKTGDILEDVPNKAFQFSQTSNVTSSFENKKDLVSDNKKPPIDFFKDIFENSSSDEESTSTDEKSKEQLDMPINSEKEVTLLENKNDTDLQKHSTSIESSVSLDKNFEEKTNIANPCVRNKKVGFGVFANLDLDALNQRKPANKSLQKNDSKNDGKEICDTLTDISKAELPDKQPKSDDTYGPELPPNFSSSYSSVPIPTAHIGESRSKEKHKSKHKHKHHKHKGKKKKKRKSSKKDTDESDSSDEFEDIPPAIIIEKLKKLQKRKS